jgi:Chaperone of endosialidase
MLTAQQAPEKLLPLKSWPSPLYWHPSQAEQAAAQALPQSQNTVAQVSTTGASATLNFVAITPCRLVDTRGTVAGFVGMQPFSGPSIPGGATVTFPVQSALEATANTAPAPSGVIPALATAYSVNVTLVPQAGAVVEYISLWAAGSAQPAVSTLNDPQGLIVANAAVVPAGALSGGVNLYNSGPATTDVIIDMNGFFVAPNYQNGDITVGPGTLANNVTGSFNTADGANVLYANTTGGFNTASGNQALENNTAGSVNTATGASGLFSNTTGSNNTAFGYLALENNTTGNDNTAIGTGAAVNAPPGNNNSIYIGSPGTANDISGSIQIGTAGTHLAFFVAGVSQSTTGLGDAVPVVIDSNGQMATNVSSEGSQEDVQNMGEASSGLLSLRPVTFRYKKAYKDGSTPLDYGLIAEEVAQVYPDLAVKDKNGKIITVQYQKLTPMLLNELEKQAGQNRQQAARIRSLENRLAALEATLAAAPKPGR